MLSRQGVLDLVPGLPAEGLTGGVVWTDAQVESSERLVIGFVRAAADAGAAVANHAAAVGVLRCGPRVVGVRIRDGSSGHETELRGRMVLNAAGAAVDGILSLAGIHRPAVPLLKAVNLVLARGVAVTHAVGARTGGRFLFLVPWRDRAIVGTAYGPAEMDAGTLAAAFRAEAASAFPWAPIGATDVAVVHRGLVPGSGGGDGLWTRSRLVDHESEDGMPGLLSMIGVKYTTARALAQEAVDRVFARLERPAPPCLTASTRLPAARPLAGSLEERTRHAVREEMAHTLADAVLRRTDLGTPGPPAEADVEAVLGTMAAELGWDARRCASERQALADAYRV